MGSKAVTSASIYLSMGLFVLGWWALAFGPTLSFSSGPMREPSPPITVIAPTSPYLHPLSRQKIHEALLGNTGLMLSLMAEWDTEARLLDAYGTAPVQTLGPTKYLKAQLLGRRILARQEGFPIDAVYPSHDSLVIDDNGKVLLTGGEHHRFLPQTYVAASFLLALAPPHEIVALPKGLRTLTELYPPSLLEQVPYDSGPTFREQLYQARPDVAFVASYSLPTTLEALRRQGCQLFTISQVNTLEDIQGALVRVGRVVGKPEEAELLALFMEATVCALDNRLIESELYGPAARPNVLYLNYYTKFTIPTSQTFTGHILDRLGINHLPGLSDTHDSRWQIPLEPERIIRLNPRAIILSAFNGEALKEQLLNHPGFQSMPAIQQQQVYTVNERIQDFPSQFAVLAYFDLVATLLEIPSCL